MSIEIRTATPDELPALMRALNAAFLETADPDARAAFVRDYWDFDRVWRASEGDRIVGTLRSWATELTVPGLARLPAGALAAVTVLPTHTRRGVLRGMVEAELAAARDRGEVFSLLYATEWPIYGRFGYGPAVESTAWTLDARGARFRGPVPPGSLDIVERDGAQALIEPVFEAHRAARPGAIRRLSRRWAVDLGLRPFPGLPAWSGWVVVHRDHDGLPDGYALYHPEEKWTSGRPDYTLVIDQCVATTATADAALWRYLAGVDLVTTLKADFRPADETLPWLLEDGRAFVETERGDGMWIAILDVVRALDARTYERTGSIVLESVLRGSEGRVGRTRVALDAEAGGARARVTQASPDITLAAGALSAAYLGGTPLRLAVLAEGVDEHRPGVLAELDAMLRTLDPPWCPTFF